MIAMMIPMRMTLDPVYIPLFPDRRSLRRSSIAAEDRRLPSPQQEEGNPWDSGPVNL